MSNEKYLLMANPRPPIPNPWPTVSFCIPTKNRSKKLERTLRCLRALEYPREIEIVVVDNGSTDNSLDVARHYADEVLEVGGYLGAVRQRSVEASSGEVLGLIDDDLYITAPDWLLHAIPQFQLTPNVSTIWPRLVPPPNATAVTTCFFNLNEAIFDDRMTRQRGVFGGGNSLFRRDAIASVGGFDTNIGFGEDMLLARKLKDGGYQVVYLDLPVTHDSMFSLAEIYKKQLWGSSAVARHGVTIMQQPRSVLIYEQYIVGTRAMVRGLMRGDTTWLSFPPIIAAKSLAYARSFIRQT